MSALKATPLLVLLSLAACHRNPPPELAPSAVQMVRTQDIESVVFIVGDMGNAIWEQSPLPHRLANEVEYWSQALRTDSSVAVLFLGDNVYPRGLRSEPQFFPADSVRLQTQVDILAGPAARANRAFGLFIAGNHDWGHMPGERGEARLRNQEEFLTRRRSQGVQVTLFPKAGVPGPGVIDVGKRLRFILIDTAWWLLSADRAEKDRLMARLDTAMRKGAGREIIMAAHHPMRSASAHGGLVSFWDVFGLKWLLNKSGTSLQDLNSLPYRDLLDRINGVFKVTGPPMIFAGGHDHSLQLIKRVEAQEPPWMVVSGAGSKSSKVGRKEGLLFENAGPGYMQLIFRRNGGVDLFIYAADPVHLICGITDQATQQKCLNDGIAGFKSRYSITLK